MKFLAFAAAALLAASPAFAQDEPAPVDTAPIETVQAEGPPHFWGRQPSAFACFEREHANIRRVMDWALERRRHDISLELIAALFRFWNSQGHLTEAIGWAEKALQVRGEAAEDLWNRSLVGISEIFKHAGDPSTTLQLKQELLDGYAKQEHADPLLLPAMFFNLAELAMNAGEFSMPSVSTIMAVVS